MLLFSLRAVLRKESWMFCAGLFSIYRSPCQNWTRKKISCSHVICGASDHKEQGGQPATSPALGQSHRESRAALGQHFVQYGLAPDFSIPLCPYVLNRRSRFVECISFCVKRR